MSSLSLSLSPICWSVCFNEIVLPRSLTVGHLSERLNCPAVTTEISISVAHTRLRSLGLVMRMFAPQIRVHGECVRVRFDRREIWICGDIDQVERSRGEHLVGEASGSSGQQKITMPLFSSSLQWQVLFVPCERATSSQDNCNQREFLYLDLPSQAPGLEERVPPDHNYPSKRSFKLLLAVKAVLY